jgi:hypothetical protein
MENYLLVIYSLMDQYFSKGDDDNLLNLLNYFETVIQDKEIANNIINTSFISLLISILSKAKNDNIKIRVCAIIAFLIRYSTVIENPLDELGLCRVLDVVVKDKNVELSKKATATLGEYLFFVTTQAEGEEETSIYWKISDESLSSLLYAIDLNRDDIVKFYAVKSIENITALTGIAKIYFAKNEQFLNKMLDIFKFSKNSELRISAIYTVSHLIRLEPKLIKNFLDKKSLNEIKKNLEEEIPKIQQAIINCILFGTYYDNTVLISSDSFINFCCFLIQTLEYSNFIIKMKIILLFALIIENAGLISKFGEKLFPMLQKLRKENNPELHLSIKVFENMLGIKIKNLTKNFSLHMNKIFSKVMNIGGVFNSSNNLYEDILQYLNCFTSLGLYPKILSSLYNLELLENLIKIVEYEDFFDEVIMRNVYEILRNFSENSTSVCENIDFIIKKMFIPILKSSFRY